MGKAYELQVAKWLRNGERQEMRSSTRRKIACIAELAPGEQ